MFKLSIVVHLIWMKTLFITSKLNSMIFIKEISKKSLKVFANTNVVIVKPELIKGGVDKGSGNDTEDIVDF